MFQLARAARAPVVRSPVPLSVRYDSLLVQCCIAAAIYFGPQDAAIAALAFVSGRAGSNSMNAPSNIQNPESALEKFYAKKGLAADAFRLRQGGSQWELRFANVYN